MQEYRVTVCCFGQTFVQAESADAARAVVETLPPEQIHWLKEYESQTPLFVVYIELNQADLDGDF